jgi:hypothetical protein
MVRVALLLACSAGAEGVRLQRLGRKLDSRAAPAGSAAIDSLFRTTRALAAGRGEAASAPKNEHRRTLTTYQQDCGVPASFAHIRAAGTKRLDNPGAGMDPKAIEPYATVLKDGFWFVDCVKDRLLEHGDKFGNNKFAYEMESSKVSIVRYLEHVAKEHRSPMTHEVCFEFCRSVPNMLFFGLAHGRDCYCAPFYDMMAGDSSECNAVCEGDTDTMCGGMQKSSIFQMHSCKGDGGVSIAIAGPEPGPTPPAPKTTTTTTTTPGGPTPPAPKVDEWGGDEWGDDDEPDYDGALVALSKTCGTRGQKLSGSAENAAQCAALAEGAGATAFSLGKNFERGNCYAETLDVDEDLVKKWQANKASPECPSPGGWQPAQNTDFYYVIEVDEYEGNTYSR